MSPTIFHKYKYFHSTVQRAKDRRQQFYFCHLPFDVKSSLISLLLEINLSLAKYEVNLDPTGTHS